MTNFNHFARPVVHFGNAHEQKPAEEQSVLQLPSKRRVLA